MKKLIHAVIAVACLSGLAGCNTAAQQVAAAQDRTCRDWGLERGSDAYASCRLELSRQQLARDIALEQEAATPIFPPMKTCSYNSNTNGGMTLGTLNCM
jgi:acetyl-CoA acetyltransferase